MVDVERLRGLATDRAGELRGDRALHVAGQVRGRVGQDEPAGVGDGLALERSAGAGRGPGQGDVPAAWRQGVANGEPVRAPPPIQAVRTCRTAVPSTARTNSRTCAV